MISTNGLFQLKLCARDGEIGCVRDLVFHDADWAIRELIVETGGWLFGPSVSIDPGDVLEPDAVAGILPVEQTREQVKNGPAGAPPLEAGGPLGDEVDKWPAGNVPPSVPVRPMEIETSALHPGLHSLREIDGFAVFAGADPVGTLAGFLIDPIAWDLPVALVQLDGDDGPIVMLPTRLVAELRRPDRTLRTHLAQTILREAPVYDPRLLDERVYLPAMADYYSARV